MSVNIYVWFAQVNIYLFIYLFIYYCISSFLFFIFFIFLFVVDFVIDWNETAMGLHVFPIPIPSPTTLSTRSL